MKATTVNEVGITIGQSLVTVLVTVFAVVLTVAVAGINTPAKTANCTEAHGTTFAQYVCGK